MSVLFKINGVPVFDEIKYARSWGQDNGLLGFHTHERDGRVGYMAGVNHAQTTRVAIVPQRRVIRSICFILADLRMVRSLYLSPAFLFAPMV